MTEDVIDFDIDRRSGWPDELRVLLNEYPRETWRTRRSALAEFWLDKHDFFRRHTEALRGAADDYREQRRTPPEFGAWVAPRLQSYISHLHGHHQIEDFHYFPAFRAAEARLASGFDVLASDHDLLHQGIVELVEAINAFIATFGQADVPDADAQRYAGDRFVDAGELLYKRLLRHLDDEEDLIIPVMLKQHG
jgi:hemerythrin-like domain-containing protein